jgi:hypothetical protein
MVRDVALALNADARVGRYWSTSRTSIDHAHSAVARIERS